MLYSTVNDNRYKNKAGVIRALDNDLNEIYLVPETILPIKKEEPTEKPITVNENEFIIKGNKEHLLAIYQATKLVSNLLQCRLNPLEHVLLIMLKELKLDEVENRNDIINIIDSIHHIFKIPRGEGLNATLTSSTQKVLYDIQGQILETLSDYKYNTPIKLSKEQIQIITNIRLE